MTVLSKLQEKIQSVRGERELNFGNEIIEILVLPACPKWKPIVAMALPKMEEKKMLRPQYFSQQITSD